MRVGIAIVFSLIATMATSAQRHTRKTASAAVRRAQSVRVSSFDLALPNLTLQAFLDYETDQAEINWTTRDCKSSADRENAICVPADSAVSDQISIFVTVRVSSVLSAQPKLVSVEVIEQGLVHAIRINELPVAIHGRRFRSREIRDIPLLLSGDG